MLFAISAPVKAWICVIYAVFPAALALGMRFVPAQAVDSAYQRQYFRLVYLVLWAASNISTQLIYKPLGTRNIRNMHMYGLYSLPCE